MEAQDFADQVGSWLDPNAIGDALLVRQQNPESADAPSEWAWRSAQFESAADVRLGQPLGLFLENFRVTAGYVRLLRSLMPDISPTVWRWLESLRFSGELILTDFPHKTEPDTIVVIRERYAVVRMLHAPLSFLCNVISQYAETWLPWADSGPVLPKPSLEQSGTGELAVYLESVIASAILNEEAVAVAVVPAKATGILNHRSYSVAGPYPLTAREMSFFRDAGERYASGLRVVRRDPG